MQITIKHHIDNVRNIAETQAAIAARKTRPKPFSVPGYHAPASFRSMSDWEHHIRKILAIAREEARKTKLIQWVCYEYASIHVRHPNCLWPSIRNEEKSRKAVVLGIDDQGRIYYEVPKATEPAA